MSEKLKVCPKCGSTNGFSYTAILKTHRSGTWGNDEDEEVDVLECAVGKTVTCGECGRRTDWNRAHGKEEAGDE